MFSKTLCVGCLVMRFILRGTGNSVGSPNEKISGFRLKFANVINAENQSIIELEAAFDGYASSKSQNRKMRR